MIQLDTDSRQAAQAALSTYLKAELDIEVNGFDAEFLIDFIARTLGPHFYNQGLRDAQGVMRERLETILETVEDMEVRPQA